MGSRNTLPEIAGGSTILRDAVGQARGSQSLDLARHAPFTEPDRKSRNATENRAQRGDTAHDSALKVKVPFNLPRDLAEQVRDAVFALSGPPHCLSLAAFAEQALRAELDRLKGVANDGRPFGARRGRLKPGRRVA